MAKDLVCPICNGDMPIGEEEPGDEVFCPSCQSPCTLGEDEDGEPEVEANF